MEEFLEMPWTVAVSFDGSVQYAIPWERVDDAWWLERVFDDEITVYLVDSRLPAPPPNGTFVDPQQLGWIEVVHHIPAMEMV